MKLLLVLFPIIVLVAARPRTDKEEVAGCPKAVDAYTRTSDTTGWFFVGDSIYTFGNKGEKNVVGYNEKWKQLYKDPSSISAALFDVESKAMTVFSGRTGYHYVLNEKSLIIELTKVQQAPAGMSPKFAFWWNKETIVLVNGDRIALLNKKWESVRDSSLEEEIGEFLKQFQEQDQIRGIDEAGSENPIVWMKDGMQTLKKGSGHVETTVYNWPVLVLNEGWICHGEGASASASEEKATTPAREAEESENVKPKTSTATVEKEKVLTGETPKTADKVEAKKPSSNSEQCSGSYVTVAFRDAILKHHNNARSLLAVGKYEVKGAHLPAAADMMKLTWNCSLEAYIRNHVAACNFEHMEKAPHGQNMAEGGQTGKVDDIEFTDTAVKSWLNEFAEFGWDNVPVYFDPAGHATQVMHAESTSLGCAIQHCPKSDMDYVNLHCMYWPAGNLPGSTVYSSGEPCSKCPAGTTCDKETSLCV